MSDVFLHVDLNFSASRTYTHNKYTRNSFSSGVQHCNGPCSLAFAKIVYRKADIGSS